MDNGLIIGQIIVLIYLLPTCNCFQFKSKGGIHPDWALIMLANIAFGWTIIGWIYCFKWSKQHINKAKNNKNQFQNMSPVEQIEFLEASKEYMPNDIPIINQKIAAIRQQVIGRMK